MEESRTSAGDAIFASSHRNVIKLVKLSISTYMVRWFFKDALVRGRGQDGTCHTAYPKL